MLLNINIGNVEECTVDKINYFKIILLQNMSIKYLKTLM